MLCVYGHLLASYFLHSALLLYPSFVSFVSPLRRACLACYVLRPNRLTDNATPRSAPLSLIHPYPNTLPLLPAPSFSLLAELS